MPIVLQNEVNPALVGALSLLTGQAEAARRRREREEELALRQQSLAQEQLAQEARDKLQRDLAGQQNTLQRYAIDARSRDSRRAQELGLAADQSQLAAQMGSRNDAIAAQLFGDVLDYQQRANFGGGGASAASQQDLAALRADASLRNRLATNIPEEITQGLQQGILRYTPEQKKEIGRLDDAIRRLATDPRMSPSDRMRGEAMLWQQKNAILNTPQEVPPDERPIPLAQQFDNETAMVEIDGRQTRVQRGERNGVPTWNVLEAPQDESAKMQLEQQKAEHQWQKSEQDLYRQAASDELKLRAERMGGIVDLQIKIASQKAALAKMKADAANQVQIDTSDAEAAIAEMQATLNGMKAEAVPQGNLSAPPSPQMPGQEMQQAPPTRDGRVVVDSEADALRYGLPDGTPIVTSSGRTGIWRSN